MKGFIIPLIESRQTLIRPIPPLLLRLKNNNNNNNNKQTNNINNKNKPKNYLFQNDATVQ